MQVQCFHTLMTQAFTINGWRDLRSVSSRQVLITISHPAELIGSLGGSDPVDGEASLDVVDDPEVLSSLVNLDDVHETSGELRVSPGLAINLDQTLLHDGLHLLHGDGVLQAVPEQLSLNS